MVPRLRPYQAMVRDAVLRSILEKQGQTFTVLMARQAGKNELSAQLEVLLLSLFFLKGGNLIKASPTFKPQTINSMLRLKERLNQAGFTGHWRAELGYMVRLGNARVLFFSAGEAANVVGATAHILLEIDEAQDVNREKFDRDFRPMGSTTNVTTVLYGTAWSSDTLLEQVKQHNLERERKDGVRRHFEFDWQEVARYNPEYARYVEGERERLGADHPLFVTQYELKPLSGGGGMFTASQRAQMLGDHPRRHQPRPGALYVAGLDLAGESEATADELLRPASRRGDSTVLTIGEVTYLEPGETSPPDPLSVGTERGSHWHGPSQPTPLPAERGGAGGEVTPVSPRRGGEESGERLALARRGGRMPFVRIVQILEWRNVRHAALYAQLVDLLRNVWRVKHVAVDATGIGQPVASYLEEVLGEHVVTRYPFTSPSKSHLAVQLLAAVNTGGLKMFVSDGSREWQEWWLQMERARLQPRPSQTLNFFVDPEAGHDDYLMSTALLVEAAQRYQPRSARGR